MDFVNEKTFEKSPVCILVDNGSLKPDAILALRRVAEQLAFRTNVDFRAAGLLHSDKVDASHLGGRPARVFVESMQELLEESHRNFLILPSLDVLHESHFQAGERHRRSCKKNVENFLVVR